jgi:thioredoxin reductase
MLNAVIIGAGPYGLSVAANFRRKGISFRIFGRPMDSWSARMPKGMLLKSDGFASNIDSPGNTYTLGQFCTERGIEYGDTKIPVRLDTFVNYGLAFRDRMVPELEEKLVTGVERSDDSFTVTIEDGEKIQARRVVLAVGITYFDHLPENLAHLPSSLCTHSAQHREVGPFRGKTVVVLGGGSSALDLAGLLHEAGADVQLVARQPELKFHGKPSNKPRSLWQKMRNPSSGLGPGWRNWMVSEGPSFFFYLPVDLRLKIVKRVLGPSGGWFIKDKVVGKVPLHLGCTVMSATAEGDKVRLRLRATDGTEKEIVADHLIAATGYKVDIDRLSFLSSDIRSQLKTIQNTPALSQSFESSVHGLYFVGLAAANSFGPLMRFAYGAAFAARTVAHAVARALDGNPARVTVPVTATSAK